MAGSHMSRRKLLRRVRRQQALAEQQQPSWTWRFSCIPTCLLFVGNGGIKSGVSQQLLLALLGSEEPTSLYLSVEIGFAIARFSDCLQCQYVSMALNGCCVQEEAERRAVSHLVTPCSPLKWTSTPLVPLIPGWSSLTRGPASDVRRWPSCGCSPSTWLSLAG